MGPQAIVGDDETEDRDYDVVCKPYYFEYCDDGPGGTGGGGYGGYNGPGTGPVGGGTGGSGNNGLGGSPNLMDGDGGSFEELYTRISNLQDLLGFGNDQIGFLLQNPGTLYLIEDYLQNNGNSLQSKGIAKIYLATVSSSRFSQLESVYNSAEWNSHVWDEIVQIQIEALEETLSDLGIEGEELIDDILNRLLEIDTNGDWEEIAQQMAVIVGEEVFDALEGLFWIIVGEFIDKTPDIARATQAVVEFGRYGENVYNNLIESIESLTTDNRLFRNFEWEGGNVGAILNNIPDEELFWLDFEDRFPESTKNPNFTGSNPPFNIDKFGLLPDGVGAEFVFKFGGNTHQNGYTIEFRKSQLPLRKIRINYP